MVLNKSFNGIHGVMECRSIGVLKKEFADNPIFTLLHHSSTPALQKTNGIEAK